mmetsp:Transcript_21775/g.35647  ORF Transcript_21775/g.35647 Transcript_21775/m.35647 type:complete len:352 (-) Transcript_21775:129-1184(-)
MQLRGYTIEICALCAIILSLYNIHFTLKEKEHLFHVDGDGWRTATTAISSPPWQSRPQHRYAVANFVDGPTFLYGVYSIHKQMERYNMTDHLSHIVIMPQYMRRRYGKVLSSWVGKENVRTVDRGYIINRVRPEQDLWLGPFNKLWFFNLTEFDKVITLDTDILLRTNIMHWFDYDTRYTPCAIQAKDDISWNSGAMVIEPSTHLFHSLLDELPNVRRYNKSHVYDHDPQSSGRSDQEFITSFFLNDTKRAKKRCIMPSESAVLTSSLIESDTFDYYNKYRPQVYQTVHFTVKKPWQKSYFEAKRGNVTVYKPVPEIICKMLWEWNESARGIEEYYDDIPPLEYDYLARCR